MYNDKSYALITGASEGLGKYLAIECAKRKINLVVTALPGSGLINFSEYLIREFEVEVMAIEKDLTTESACHEIYSAIKERQITINILVNNAGVGGTFPFEQKDPWFLKKIIDLNVIAPTLLSKLFLNDLKLSSPSFIMNVSSLAGMFDLPGKQVYGGTKSYLISFSKSLRKELRGQVSVSETSTQSQAWLSIFTGDSASIMENLSNGSLNHPLPKQLSSNILRRGM